jgi:hypothetical protein
MDHRIKSRWKKEHEEEHNIFQPLDLREWIDNYRIQVSCIDVKTGNPSDFVSSEVFRDWVQKIHNS